MVWLVVVGGMLAPSGRIGDHRADRRLVNLPMRPLSAQQRIGCRTRDTLTPSALTGESVRAYEGASVLDHSVAIDLLRRCALFAHASDDGLRALAGQMRQEQQAGAADGDVVPGAEEVGLGLVTVEHEVVEVLLQTAIELRDEVEGGTKLGARANEPARRSDQAKHRRRLRERLSRASPVRGFEAQRISEPNEVSIGLEGPHTQKLVYLLAVAALHDAAGVTQVPPAAARARFC